MNAKTCRRRPKPGASYHGVWLTHDPRDAFAAGFCCTLAVVPDEPAEDVSDEDHYSVEARVEDGRVKSWTMQRLTQDGEVSAYVLPGNLSRCNCPAGTHRPGRICRHRAALHDALTELGFELPPLK